VIYNRPVFFFFSRSCICVLMLLVGAALFSQTASQAPAPQNTPKSTDPTLVTCGDKPPFSSRTVKSDVLIAPDGKHRAYAEMEATALQPQRAPGYTGPLCINNSRLFVSADPAEFKLTFLQEPADVETGNFLRPVDWSADGRRLLAEVSEWQYEQPGANRSVLIYDSRYGTFQQPEFAHLLAKLYGHECAFNFRALGFSSQGTIALEAQPLTPEEEEVFGLSSCARKKTYFEMDRATENLVSVPEMPKVQHYGRTETAKP
jgi:hypothetical protein